MAVIGLLAAATVATPGILAKAGATTPAAAGEYVPLSASLAFDTSSGTFGDAADGAAQHSGPLLPGQTANFDFLGKANVPTSGVLAVVLHITTSGGTSSPASAGDGYVWAYTATSGSALDI
jgi:hypothetical protein